MPLEIGPATQQDFLDYAGQLPPYRVRAWAGRLDGKVIGLGGLLILPDGTHLAFFDLDPEARPAVAQRIHRAGLSFMREVVQSCGARVVATAHEATPRSDAWLVRLGFVKHEADGTAVYIHENRTPQ